jgi:hypothetical protein
MATLSTLVNNKYDEHVTNLEDHRPRRAELTETDLLKSVTQQVRWLMGAVNGSATEMTAALAELEEIYDSTITSPTNLVGSTVTELNTRRGQEVALTAGNNTIAFSSAMDSADYTLTFICYTSEGGMIQWSYDPDDQTVNGFDIHVASAGFINYIAIAN